MKQRGEKNADSRTEALGMFLSYPFASLESPSGDTCAAVIACGNRTTALVSVRPGSDAPLCGSDNLDLPKPFHPKLKPNSGVLITGCLR